MATAARPSGSTAPPSPATALRTAGRGARTGWLIAATLAVAIAGNVAARLVQETLCCGDDAIFAVVARNLAAGHGYVSTLSPLQAGRGEVRAFDPASTTTGPTLVVPSAAAIRLLGNRYWVPGAVTAAITAALLAALAAVWRRLLGPGAGWACALLLVLLQLATVEFYAFWFALLGEGPAVLLVLLGASLLALTPRRAGVGFAAGLALGAAMLTKAIAAVAVAAIAAALSARAVADRMAGRGPAMGRGLRAPLAFAAGLGLPPLAFEAWKLGALGWPAYLALKDAERAFVRDHASSGIAAFASGGLASVLHTGVANARVLAELAGGAVPAAALVGALAVGVAAHRAMRVPGERLVALLAAAGLGHTLWWLAGSPGGWPRHLAPALLLLAAGAAVGATRCPIDARSAAFAVLAALALVPRAARLPDVVARPPYFEPSARTRAMLATAARLDVLPPGARKAAISWYSVQDLEYLAERTGGFTLLHRLPAHERAGTWLVGSRAWNARYPDDAAAWQEAVDAGGAHLVFKAYPYVVYRLADRAPPYGVDARRRPP